ncbi:MAG TPA: hypothetical protein VN253_20265 [Kofleriaceae bacterium]|nr:hypothetical protein [Kofleriaceae bacterium]
MGLSKVAKAQVREIIREEIRAELGHILSPTFIELVTRGATDMERLFDTVIESDRRYTSVEQRLKFVEDLLPSLGGASPPRTSRSDGSTGAPDLR